MSIKTMALAVTLASCTIVGLGAASASAGVTPSPSDSPSPCVTHFSQTNGPDGRGIDCNTPPPRPVQQCAPVRPTFFAPTATPSDEVSPTDATLSAYHGTPTPVPTRPVVNPLRCSPEQFRIWHADIGSRSLLNLVIASGPVFGTGSDRQIADTRNVFDLPGTFRSVNVRHTGIAGATWTVNLPTCTVDVTENGVWRFAGGTGLFNRAIGNGVFNLSGQWKFGNVRTPRGPVCALAFVRGNPLLSSRVNPISDSFSVVGVGLARR